MKRRSFLGGLAGILVAGVAPAIVTQPMKIVRPFEGIIIPSLHPLHFGNMAWKPELVLVTPLTRADATIKELVVQPAFKHITQLPIMAGMRLPSERTICKEESSSVDWQEFWWQEPLLR